MYWNTSHIFLESGNYKIFIKTSQQRINLQAKAHTYELSTYMHSSLSCLQRFEYRRKFRLPKGLASLAKVLGTPQRRLHLTGLRCWQPSADPFQLTWISRLHWQSSVRQRFSFFQKNWLQPDLWHDGLFIYISSWWGPPYADGAPGRRRFSGTSYLAICKRNAVTPVSVVMYNNAYSCLEYLSNPDHSH